MCEGKSIQSGVFGPYLTEYNFLVSFGWLMNFRLILDVILSNEILMKLLKESVHYICIM